ncbi:Lipid A core-O-antigen ligase and related enzymes [Bordetella ansorpii]|uniref:Lipid A core-O-antigen ligase and related enzymes n=1 Tax=Bordetella ansorpii TaxID=288768 RepID=A0A157S553_9BORD|nr:O-antigen ligase family protein [Bordetella ansorpii]SAI65537.1 Lipid A core-O-antigen ligase and related enzymes [Bordetella ansorpii]
MQARYRHPSTLPWLCVFVFCALALSNEWLVLAVGEFKLAGFDLAFLAIVFVKCIRLADPAAYTLPPPRVTLPMALNALAIGYLLLRAQSSAATSAADIARDLRIVLYFLLTPFLCYKDIDGPRAHRRLQWTIVASGLAVSTLMVAKQMAGFSTIEPVRDANLGVWVLPMAVVSILYFRQPLGLKPRTAYLMILYMVVALVFSLNRSQYLQLGLTLVIAVALGGRVGAMRRATLLFAPAIVAGMLIFHAIGYLDVLSSRVLSVETLDQDSSYGARVQEYEGQMALFRESPTFGHGPGLRSWVMGEDGFELSTFSHNSWVFYLMKFGVVGTLLLMAPAVLMLVAALGRRHGDEALELHRRYLIACVPVYILIDSMSAGLAYAPKTAFTGFLLCYCLSLLRLYRPPLAFTATPVKARVPVAPRPEVTRPAPARPVFPRLPDHG